MITSACSLGVWLSVTSALAPGADPAGDVAARKAELAKLAPQLEALYGNIGEGIRGLDRQQFEPQAVVEHVGRDPQRLFEWVRDKTRLRPYRGALRGPSGVLMDRCGNSLDRSLLLAEMLRGIGCEARLANATLSKDQATQLLNALASAREPEAPASAEAREARSRVQRHAAQILKMIGATPPAAAAGPDRQSQALSDHWWVQRKEGAAWVDMDPSGVAGIKAARNVAFKSQGERLALDARDCQEVDFRVVIEAFKGGRLQTEIVLKHTLRPSEVLGRTLDFAHILGEPLNDADLANDPASRKRLKAELARRELYVPTLFIDERPVTDASFTTAGEVDHNPNPDPSGKLAAAAGNAMGTAFGGLGGPGGASKPSGVLTAEWIEYEIRIPGQPAQTVRREVFDLIGPAARAARVSKEPVLDDAQKLVRARMLLGRTRILVQPCAIPSSFLTFTSARGDLREKDIVTDLIHGRLDTPAKWTRAMSKLCGRDRMTPMVALIRSGIGSTETFIDSPNIVHHRLWMSEGKDDQLVLEDGIDLARTSTDAIGPASFSTRLGQGVADTLAEHLALGGDAIAMENTMGVFEAGAAKQVAPVVLRSTDGAAGVAKLHMPADAGARATADIVAGNTLVLSGDVAGRWAWWRVDPRTGQTVGVMDTGYNATVEKAKLEGWIANAAERWGERITSKALENASKNQITSWSRGIAARESLLTSWQTALRAITVNGIRAASAGG